MARRTAVSALLAALAAALGAVGCGGSSEQPGTVTVVETVAGSGAIAETGAPADTGAGAGPADAGDLVLQFVPTGDTALQSYADFLAGSGLMDGIVDEINAAIALPQDNVVSVETSGGDPSPFYSADIPGIIMPPEWVQFSEQLFAESGIAESQEEVDTLTLASTAFVFYHELGHLLISQLGIPTTGKEEDAVDQLATVIVTQAGTDAGNIALAGATFFGLLADDRDAFDASDFWDEHSLDEQRFFNIVCWVYGSNPGAYAETVAESGIGEDRLARCGDEYAQILTSWSTLLAPYVKG